MGRDPWYAAEQADYDDYPEPSIHSRDCDDYHHCEIDHGVGACVTYSLRDEDLVTRDG